MGKLYARETKLVCYNKHACLKKALLVIQTAECKYRKFSQQKEKIQEKEFKGVEKATKIPTKEHFWPYNFTELLSRSITVGMNTLNAEMKTRVIYFDTM